MQTVKCEIRSRKFQETCVVTYEMSEVLISAVFYVTNGIRYASHVPTMNCVDNPHKMYHSYINSDLIMFDGKFIMCF